MSGARRTCTVVGCQRPHKARGLCKRHYERDRYWADHDRELARKRTTRRQRAGMREADGR